MAEQNKAHRAVNGRRIGASMELVEPSRKSILFYCRSIERSIMR